MPVPAAADAGRRDFARLVLLAAAYLLVAPWGFMLAPLVGLLLVSHPGNRREWMALAIAVPLLVASLAGTGGLFEQFVRAAGMILAGCFVMLMLWRPGPFLRRAALATAATAVLLLAWGRRYGVGWNAVQADAARLTGEYFSAQTASSAAQGESGEAFRRFVQQVGDAAAGAVPLYPAILALGALGGLAVAWRLYHRLAGQPIAGPAAPFREFRFSDQVVWAPVLALAALLLPVADSLAGLPVRPIAQ
nr:hypothetical protein [Gemmatimonadales bacterium]